MWPDAHHTRKYQARDWSGMLCQDCGGLTSRDRSDAETKKVNSVKTISPAGGGASNSGSLRGDDFVLTGKHPRLCGTPDHRALLWSSKGRSWSRLIKPRPLRQWGTLFLLLVSLLPRDAAAQQRTFYGADGRMTARCATDSQGTTICYDARGNRIGSGSR